MFDETLSFLGGIMRKIMLCSVESCERKCSAKGFCNLHYQRHIRGIPMDGNKKKSLLDRILQKTKKMNNGCWIWTGAKTGGPGDDKFKYGYIRIKNKSKRVHRVLFEETNKMKIGKLFLLHKCDTPLCINPDHMRIGTQVDNVKDMISKNRDIHPVGEGNNSKLKEKDVLKIRREAKGGTSYASLSRKYGVCTSHVRKIVIGEKWKYLR
ncbi:MAG: hypothetical protein HN597_14965 [Desulfobacula sp.]|nr:hypothetical protein [Desulfobacula sp.]